MSRIAGRMDIFFFSALRNTPSEGKKILFAIIDANHVEISNRELRIFKLHDLYPDIISLSS